MSTKTIALLALAAGFIGGIVSQRIAPAPVYAQAQTPIQKEIRAESFVIVDENGMPRGAFGVDKKGDPMIEVTDTKGHPYGGRFDPSFKWGPVPDFKAKPRLVPSQ
jgi:hypothetical protein